MGSGRYENNSVEFGEQTSSVQGDSFSFSVARDGGGCSGAWGELIGNEVLTQFPH